MRILKSDLNVKGIRNLFKMWVLSSKPEKASHIKEFLMSQKELFWSNFKIF